MPYLRVVVMFKHILMRKYMVAALVLAVAIVFAAISTVKADTKETITLGSYTLEPSKKAVAIAYNLDKSELFKVKQVMLHITLTPSGDPYARLLLTALGDGSTATVLYSKTWKEANPKWSKFINGKYSGQIDGKYTAIIAGAVEKQFDITSYIKNHPSGEIIIGISTGVGSWDLAVDLVIVKEEMVQVAGYGVETPVLAALGGIGCLGLAYFVKKKEEI